MKGMNAMKRTIVLTKVTRILEYSTSVGVMTVEYKNNLTTVSFNESVVKVRTAFTKRTLADVVGYMNRGASFEIAVKAASRVQYSPSIFSIPTEDRILFGSRTLARLKKRTICAA